MLAAILVLKVALFDELTSIDNKRAYTSGKLWRCVADRRLRPGMRQGAYSAQAQTKSAIPAQHSPAPVLSPSGFSGPSAGGGTPQVPPMVALAQVQRPALCARMIQRAVPDYKGGGIF